MNHLLSPRQGLAYDLAPELKSPGYVSQLQKIAPDEIALDELLLRKLGARGWGRIHQFRHCYQSDWGESGGRMLSPRAFENFSRFLSEAQLPSGEGMPSVFLTDRGGIELCWEDRVGKAIQVEFTKDGVEFLLASTEEEGFLPVDRVSELSAKLFH